MELTASLPRSVAQQTALLFDSKGQQIPEPVLAWLRAQGYEIACVGSGDELMTLSLRGRPAIVVFDARKRTQAAFAACGRMKRDPYTAIVPAIMLVGASEDAVAAALNAGADEAIPPDAGEVETTARLVALLRRSERDIYVHPSTRLPGTITIEAEIRRRLAGGVLFAVCYADLDHFKEFNDRYGYYEGDRIIRLLAQILHDVVCGLCADEGFVGHIGGDDFIFIIPVARVNEVCTEVIAVFDALAPQQYSEHDRRAGYFFGKDRRGQLHRVPLMTLSIGVVSNERRTFADAAQVSELATEMKSYAKTLSGSVFTIDRRHDPLAADAEAPVERADVYEGIEDS
jgi:GGDEF domain-containing protein